jgi:hypothetical protein
VIVGCPGYLSVGGEYTQKVSGYLNGLPIITNPFSTIVTYFNATGRDLCFYKRDANSACEWAERDNACSRSGRFYIDEVELKMGNWRVPNLAELGRVDQIVIDQGMSRSDNSSYDFENEMRRDNYWSSTKYSSEFGWWWQFMTTNNDAFVPDAQPGSPDRRARGWVRCVRPF